MELETIVNKSIVSLIISAELVVVFFIYVFAVNLSTSLKTEDFKYIRRAWAVNLVYVLFALTQTLFTLFSKIYGAINYLDNYAFNAFVTALDISQFGFLFYALRRSEYNFLFKKIIIKKNSLIFVISFMVFCFAIWLVWEYIKIDFSKHLHLHLLPSILFNMSIIFLSAEFFKNIFKEYKVSYSLIYTGSIFYGLIQIIALFQIADKNEEIMEVIGWGCGLISKTLICLGLLIIFKEVASRTRRLEKILKNLFHELNNLLYGISGPLQNILNEPKNQPIKHALEIEKTYESIVAIIDSTKMLYKNELNEITTEDNIDVNVNIENNIHSLYNANKYPVKLNSLVEVSIKITKRLSGKNVNFHTDYGGSCEIMCFQHEIVQVLVNLFKNSYESFNMGIGNIYIKTRNKYNDGDSKSKRAVVIEIVDDGPGIEELNQSKIFTYGFTTKSSSGGSGIGLSVVKNIIDGYGSIKLESPVKDYPQIYSAGTKFIIIFDKS